MREYKHTLEVIEYPTFYSNPIIDGVEMKWIMGIKIEREIKPGKDNELNRVVIKYHKEEQRKDPDNYETLVLEDVKVIIKQAE